MNKKYFCKQMLTTMTFTNELNHIRLPFSEFESVNFIDAIFNNLNFGLYFVYCCGQRQPKTSPRKFSTYRVSPKLTFPLH